MKDANSQYLIQRKARSVMKVCQSDDGALDDVEAERIILLAGLSAVHMLLYYVCLFTHCLILLFLFVYDLITYINYLFYFIFIFFTCSRS